MGFQDNSGDIIFDVVLTDEGRAVLSDPQTDFKISKFKVSDDEINYELYNLNTGSAYQDLQILQTPVFEAFTNNTSNMSSLLVTYTRNDLLYLPVVKLNQLGDIGGMNKMHTDGAFMVAVDTATEGTGQSTIPNTALAYITSGGTTSLVPGFLFGVTSDKKPFIRVDAGIDNNSRPPGTNDLEATLKEKGYLIELDSRLGMLTDLLGNELMEIYTDDDGIRVYEASIQSNEAWHHPVISNQEFLPASATQVIAGLRSSILQFKIKSSVQLRQSNFYFDKFGSLDTMTDNGTTGASNNVRVIDTLIKVTGILTGYSLDIPVRFVKLVA